MSANGHGADVFETLRVHADGFARAAMADMAAAIAKMSQDEDLDVYHHGRTLTLEEHRDKCVDFVTHHVKKQCMEVTWTTEFENLFLKIKDTNKNKTAVIDTVGGQQAALAPVAPVATAPQTPSDVVGDAADLLSPEEVEYVLAAAQELSSKPSKVTTAIVALISNPWLTSLATDSAAHDLAVDHVPAQPEPAHSTLEAHSATFVAPVHDLTAATTQVLPVVPANDSQGATAHAGASTPATQAVASAPDQLEPPGAMCVIPPQVYRSFATPTQAPTSAELPAPVAVADVATPQQPLNNTPVAFVPALQATENGNGHAVVAPTPPKRRSLAERMTSGSTGVPKPFSPSEFGRSSTATPPAPLPGTLFSGVASPATTQEVAPSESVNLEGASSQSAEDNKAPAEQPSELAQHTQEGFSFFQRIGARVTTSAPAGANAFDKQAVTRTGSAITPVVDRPIPNFFANSGNSSAAVGQPAFGGIGTSSQAPSLGGSSASGQTTATGNIVNGGGMAVHNHSLAPPPATASPPEVKAPENDTPSRSVILTAEEKEKEKIQTVLEAKRMLKKAKFTPGKQHALVRLLLKPVGYQRAMRNPRAPQLPEPTEHESMWAREQMEDVHNKWKQPKCAVFAVALLGLNDDEQVAPAPESSYPRSAALHALKTNGQSLGPLDVPPPMRQSYQAMRNGVSPVPHSTAPPATANAFTPASGDTVSQTGFPRGGQEARLGNKATLWEKGNGVRRFPSANSPYRARQF